MNLEQLSMVYSVRRLNPDDVEAIYTLYKTNPLYFQHCPPSPTKQSILDDLKAIPPGKTLKDKYFIGYFRGEQLIAVLDLIQGFPEEKTAFIGLFMTDASVQGQGIGSRIIEDLCASLEKVGSSKVRLAWVEGNPQAEHFWRKNGFMPMGNVIKQEHYRVVPAEKALPAPKAERLNRSVIGTFVPVIIDRPRGSAHPEQPQMIYPIPYGFVPGRFAGDGKEQDVYVLGSQKEGFQEGEAKVIALYHRFNDEEDKWIVSLDGGDYTDQEILEAIEFQEQYFEGILVR